MSQVNPYAPTQEQPSDVRSVTVRPLKLLKRAVLLMGDQYGTLLAATLSAVLIGSVVPLGVLLGPMMVGLYLCFLKREQGVPVEFATLFKGFDYFLESLVAMLLMVGVSFVVVLPVIGIFAIAVAVPLSTGGELQGMRSRLISRVGRFAGRWCGRRAPSHNGCTLMTGTRSAIPTIASSTIPRRESSSRSAAGSTGQDLSNTRRPARTRTAN